MFNLVQPFHQDITVFFGLFYETRVTGTFEDLPTAVGNVFVERCRDYRCADVAGAAADHAGLLDLIETVGVFEIGQVT